MTKKKRMTDEPNKERETKCIITILPSALVSCIHSFLCLKDYMQFSTSCRIVQAASLSTLATPATIVLTERHHNIMWHQPLPSQLVRMRPTSLQLRFPLTVSFLSSFRKLRSLSLFQLHSYDSLSLSNLIELRHLTIQGALPRSVPVFGLLTQLETLQVGEIYGFGLQHLPKSLLQFEAQKVLTQTREEREFIYKTLLQLPLLEVLKMPWNFASSEHVAMLAEMPALTTLVLHRLSCAIQCVDLERKCRDVVKCCWCSPFVAGFSSLKTLSCELANNTALRAVSLSKSLTTLRLSKPYGITTLPANIHIAYLTCELLWYPTLVLPHLKQLTICDAEIPWFDLLPVAKNLTDLNIRPRCSDLQTAPTNYYPRLQVLTLQLVGHNCFPPSWFSCFPTLTQINLPRDCSPEQVLEMLPYFSFSLQQIQLPKTTAAAIAITKKVRPSIKLISFYTEGAKELLLAYLESNPRINEIEIEEHKIDPVRQPEEFFAAELKEPYHRKIQVRTKAVGGRVTKHIMQAWAIENSIQHKT